MNLKGPSLQARLLCILWRREYHFTCLSSIAAFFIYDRVVVTLLCMYSRQQSSQENKLCSTGNQFKMARLPSAKFQDYLVCQSITISVSVFLYCRGSISSFLNNIAPFTLKVSGTCTISSLQVIVENDRI